jgi:hypothetical protein
VTLFLPVLKIRLLERERERERDQQQWINQRRFEDIFKELENNIMWLKGGKKTGTPLEVCRFPRLGVFCDVLRSWGCEHQAH